MAINKTLTDYIWKDVVPTDIATLVNKSAEYLVALGIDLNTATEAISKMCNRMQGITPNEIAEITNKTLLKMNEEIDFIGAQTTDQKDSLEIFGVKSPISNEDIILNDEIFKTDLKDLI